MPLLYVGPGVIKVRYRDLAKQERTHERQLHRRRVDAEIARLCDLDEAAQESTREVREWSRKSRARMVETFAGLDWSPIQHVPWAPAMLTLTLPGDWLTVAPSGKDFKRLVRTFEKRWLRAWGFEPIWLWKLEFQRRGAPHLHMFAVLPPPSARAGDHRRLTPEEAAELGVVLTRRPRSAVGDGLALRDWLSEVWADVVAHPDPEEREKHRRAGVRVDYAEAVRLRDPRRMSVYFSKHGSFKDKDYQNVVPREWQEPGKGPGRFWGFKGLRPAVAGATVQQENALWAQRILRRYSRAQGVTAEHSVPRGGVPIESKYPDVIGLAGAQLWESYQPRYRKVRRRVVRFAGSKGGFMCINDAPAFAAQLAQAVAVAGRPPGKAAACLPWEHVPAPKKETLKPPQLVEYYRRKRQLEQRKRWEALAAWVDAQHPADPFPVSVAPAYPDEVQQAFSL